MRQLAAAAALGWQARLRAETPAALETKRAASGHVMVRPLIDGKDHGWFIFDTGAGINVLDSSTADAIG